MRRAILENYACYDEKAHVLYSGCLLFAVK